MRVGIDLAATADVQKAIASFGDRYLSRLFTAREIADSAGSPTAQAASLAARFAAKEATLKVLRVSDDAPEWTDIELRREPGGWCSLHLSGRAAIMARRADLGAWDVSITHEGSMAAAVVAARQGA